MCGGGKCCTLVGKVASCDIMLIDNIDGCTSSVNYIIVTRFLGFGYVYSLLTLLSQWTSNTVMTSQVQLLTY